VLRHRAFDLIRGGGSTPPKLRRERSHPVRVRNGGSLETRPFETPLLSTSPGRGRDAGSLTPSPSTHTGGGRLRPRGLRLRSLVRGVTTRTGVNRTTERPWSSKRQSQADNVFHIPNARARS